jgi:hypothetical protein
MVKWSASDRDALNDRHSGFCGSFSQKAGCHETANV